MKQITVFGALALVIPVLNSGCDSSEIDPVAELRSSNDAAVEKCIVTPTTAYNFELPAHIPQFAVSNNNLTTEEGVALGKRLYYDLMLSEGGPLQGNACATCHVQETNFANNEPGTSVLPHTNLNWANFFLWDGKISGSLEDIMEFEIAEFFQTNAELFKADASYQKLNCEAFGTSDISTTDMANALAQWLRTHVSFNSRYDLYKANLIDLTPQEKRGELLFNSNLGDCFKCHQLPLTTDNSFHNNGLEADPVNASNPGRHAVTGDPSDYGRFKTPSLRNAELTAPYMHDGRFQTLEEVIEHYNSGVQFSETLDVVMVTPDRLYNLQMDDSDKAALVAFLKTFTDTAYLNNPEFSNPF